MKKRFVSLLLMLAVAISVVTTAAYATDATKNSANGSKAADNEAVIEVGAVTAKAGETATVPVTLTKNSGIAGVAFDITYGEALTLKKITKGEVLSNGSFSGNASKGVLYWYDVDGDQNTTTTGVMFTLEFEVAAQAKNGDYFVKVSPRDNEPANITDINSETVPTTYKDGKVTVTGGIDVHEHTLVAHAAKKATCTEDGNDAYWSCSGCDKLFSDAKAANEIAAVPVIKAAGHKTEVKNAKAATCTSEGYTGDEVCTVCDQTIKKGQTVEKLKHTYDDGVVTTEPTCVKEGVKTYTCTVCGDSYTESIAKVAHKTELQNVKAATCTVEGYTGDEVCTVCGQTIKKGQTVEKLKHTYDNGVVTEEPTCVKEGVKTYTCTVCGDSYTESIAKVAHKTELKNAKEATCTEAGATGDEVCTTCGATIKASESIPAKGHKTETNGYVAPTCTESGWTGTGICTVCGETVSENTEIPATGHTKVEIPAVDATCTEDGSTAGIQCSVCGEVLTAPEKVPAKGHTKVEIPAVDATCTADGSTAGAKCSVCGEILTAPEKVPAKGHAWDDGKVTQEPTLTKEGIKTYTCTVCGETKTESIEKLATCDGGKDCPAYNYTDVDVSLWYHLDIDYVLQKNLMVGYGNGIFRPDGKLTRAQMVQVLYNWAGKPEVTGSSKFSDVENGAWYAKPIIWAAENGIVNGVGDGKFAPNALVTREQLAAMLYRYAGEPKVSEALTDFADAETVSAYAVDAVKWAVQQDILRGDGTPRQLRPTDGAKRSEVAAMLHRYIG